LTKALTLLLQVAHKSRELSHFGGSAVISTLEWMKTRNFASPGFPGFAFVAWFGFLYGKKSNPGDAGVAWVNKMNHLIFRQPGNHTGVFQRRPMALRLRLSPDLPLSEEKLKF
jgi:hypothetical protein